MTDHFPGPTVPASSESLAELRAQCRADYEQAAANRAAAAGAARDQLALARAHAAEAVYAR
ncbi:hypothetical protein [Streptomyces sp. NPDC017230]|uniref:hypothetical protein n=1 Tax=unclassified Streptomyces TaxID=2593676 RepID=UPI0037B82B9C